MIMFLKIFKEKKRAFTLIEVIISSALFLMGMVMISQVYLSLVRSIILAQKLQANIDGARFGLEKIWNEIKSGINFTTSTNYDTSTLTFKDRRCREITFKKYDDELLFQIGNSTTSIFDSQLIKVNDFYYYFDNLDDPNNNDYTVSSRKLVKIYLDLSFKTENGLIPFKIETAIAPLTSPKTQTSPCP